MLDGGLPRWRASGYDVESSASSDAILKASAASEAIEKVYQGQAVSLFFIDLIDVFGLVLFPLFMFHLCTFEFFLLHVFFFFYVWELCQSFFSIFPNPSSNFYIIFIQ